MKYGIGMNYILRMVMDWPVKMVIGENDVDGKDSLLVRCFTYIYILVCDVFTMARSIRNIGAE